MARRWPLYWDTLIVMTTSETTNSPTGNQSLDPADPRYGLAAALTGANRVIGAASQLDRDGLNRPTPCPEFTVEELLEHMLFVARRVAWIGSGGHFAETPADPVGGQWGSEFQTRAEAIHGAWADPAKLNQTFQVPWGEAPGAALMMTYTAEFAAHSWDLAKAIGVDIEIDDSALVAAAGAVKFIPAEGRDDPAIPFGPVVDAPADATNLEQILTWTGRSLDWTAR